MLGLVEDLYIRQRKNLCSRESQKFNKMDHCEFFHFPWDCYSTNKENLLRSLFLLLKHLYHLQTKRRKKKRQINKNKANRVWEDGSMGNPACCPNVKICVSIPITQIKQFRLGSMSMPVISVMGKQRQKDPKDAPGNQYSQPRSCRLS